MYNVYCQLTQKTNENASPSHPPPRFAAGQKLKLIGFSKFVRLGKQSTKLVDEISVHCEVIGPTCSISLFPSNRNCISALHHRASLRLLISMI